MENFSLNVISLQKHEIIYRQAKQKNILGFTGNAFRVSRKQEVVLHESESHNQDKKRSFGLVATFAIFVVTLSLLFSASYLFKDYGNYVKQTMSFINDPNSLKLGSYDDVIFTSVYGEYNTDKEVSFLLPIKTNTYESDDTGINFTIEEVGLVTASANGIVVNVGNLVSGGKYVIIKHSKNTTSRYDNIDISGVVPGDTVKVGQQIGTAKTGSVVKFSIDINGKSVKNLKINTDKIVWEK